MDAATTRAVSDLSNMAYGLAILFMVVWAGGAAAAIFKRRVMPQWFGILSVAAALGGFTGIVSVVSAGLGVVIDVGFVLLVVWVLTASVIMLRKPTAA